MMDAGVEWLFSMFDEIEPQIFRDEWNSSIRTNIVTVFGRDARSLLSRTFQGATFENQIVISRSMILTNAFNGETFIFPRGPQSAEPAGFRVILQPGGSGGGNALTHVHPLVEETFHVHSGCIAVVLRGQEQLVRPGQTATVPRGAAHFFRNAGDVPAEITVTFSAPQRLNRFFMNFGLLVERHPEWFSASGDPHLLLIALVLHTYRDHLYLAGVPVVFQKALFACLAPIARWRGYRLELDPW